MELTFSNSLSKILDLEGGLTNDPNDPGGLTNFGISQRENPDISVKDLTPATVAPIYKSRYWDAIGADNLPSPLNFIAFDTAVNEGPGFAKQLLASTSDVTKYVNMRMSHYRLSPNWGKYGTGWTNRVLHVLTYALGGS